MAGGDMLWQPQPEVGQKRRRGVQVATSEATLSGFSSRAERCSVLFDLDPKCLSAAQYFAFPVFSCCCIRLLVVINLC